MDNLNEEQVKKIVQDQISTLFRTDKYVFERLIEIANGKNIKLGDGTGTKIGTTSTQKLGLYGTTPTAKQATVSAPSGGATVDSQARSAIGELIIRLQTIGIIS